MKSINPSRFNLYKLIHKYIRPEMSKVVTLAGSFDLSNPVDKKKFTSSFTELKTLLDDHAHREDKYFNPLLKESGSTKQLEALEKEHKSLGDDLNKLDRELSTITTADQAYKFYLNLSGYQSRYLRHLNEEETTLLAELHENFDDSRLRAVNSELLQSMPREYVVEVTKGMLITITHLERVELFNDMREAMPPEPFNGMCELARLVLTSEQLEKLFVDIGIAPQKDASAITSGPS